MLLMAIQLTSKETSLLKDQQTHENVCIQKYQKYAQQANDPQLKQLFSSYAEQEQQHLASVTQMLNGQIPTTSAGSNQSNQQSGGQNPTTTSSTATQGTIDSQANQSDAALCNDMLMTEKYVSGAYDTAIFEFTDTNMRQVLNHIQKEEQGHGEGLFQYMQSKGLYNPQ